MNYSHEVERMCTLTKGPKHGPAPIPEEGKWVKAYEISDISGLTHGVGWCAPQDVYKRQPYGCSVPCASRFIFISSHCCLVINTERGLLPSKGPIIPLASISSINRAARAYPTFNFR